MLLLTERTICYNLTRVGITPRKADLPALRRLSLPDGADVGMAVNDAMPAIEDKNPDLERVLPKTHNRLSDHVLRTRQTRQPRHLEKAVIVTKEANMKNYDFPPALMRWPGFWSTLYIIFALCLPALLIVGCRPTVLVPPAESPTPAAGSLLWRFLPDDVNKVSPQSSASVAGGVVYVGASDVPGGSKGSLHALDATDGTLLWSYDHEGHTPSTPTIASGVVYFGSEDHNVYAVDAVEGTERWAFETGAHVRADPAVFETTVFVNSQDGYLYALDALDGTLRWRFRFDEPVSLAGSLGDVPASPTVEDGAVFIVGTDNVVQAVNIADGTLRWEFPIERQVFSSPVAANKLVFVSSLNGNLYTISASDGTLQWSFDAGGPIASTPGVADGTVYVGNNQGVLWALNAADGAVLWQYDSGMRGFIVSPAVENGVVYVASVDGMLYAIDDRGGTLLATYAVGEEISLKAPAAANGIVYFVTKERSLYAVKMNAP